MAQRLVILAKEAGFKGLFAGLGPRMVMTAGLVSGQFLLYDAFKQGEAASSRFSCAVWMLTGDVCGCLALGAPPGLEIHKAEK